MRLHLLLVILGILAFGCAKPIAETNSANGPTAGKAQIGCKAILQSDAVCLDAVWEKYPTESTFGTLLVIARSLGTEHLVTEFTDDLRVTLWMPSMGHGSSPVKVVRLQPGLYRIEKVFFNMRGDWEVRFQTPTDQAAWALDF